MSSKQRRPRIIGRHRRPIDTEKAAKFIVAIATEAVSEQKAKKDEAA